ncbi:MAG: G8 domain-containing protein, partial [Acidobacteriota bacterium]
MSTTRFLAGLVAVGWLAWGAVTASAQMTHDHGMAVNGVPGGLPYFCANPTVTSVADGAWSNPATWSTKTVPAANDKVLVAAGHTVTYDAVSDAAIQCIDLRGRLGFKTDASTRLRVVDLTVMEGGVLEVGTPAAPVRPSVTAEIVIADRATDRVLDPAQVGTGIEALGTVTMSGAPKSPTFARLAKEPLAGQRTLTFEQSVAAWKPGDRLVLPDTRQLRASERNSYYKSQDEKVEIASVAGATVTLTSALAYDHRGAHDADGA